jgi:hypothetical protein
MDHFLRAPRVRAPSVPRHQPRLREEIEPMDLLAYLDAGSGSIILQALIGGFAAAAVALKLFWRRILTVLHIRKPDEDPKPAPAAETEAREPESAVAEPTR